MWQHWYLFFARFVSISPTYQKAWLWSNFRKSGIVTYLWKMCEREYNQVFRNMPWHCGIYNGIPTTKSETNQKKQIARQPTKNQSTTSAKPVVDNITTTTMSTAECKRHVCNKRKQKATTNQLNWEGIQQCYERTKNK